VDGFHQTRGGVEGSREYSDECLGSIKGTEFSGYQSSFSRRILCPEELLISGTKCLGRGCTVYTAILLLCRRYTLFPISLIHSGE
jgi:hypothetical protein